MKMQRHRYRPGTSARCREKFEQTSCDWVNVGQQQLSKVPKSIVIYSQSVKKEKKKDKKLKLGLFISTRLLLWNRDKGSLQSIWQNQTLYADGSLNSYTLLTLLGSHFTATYLKHFLYVICFVYLVGLLLTNFLENSQILPANSYSQNIALGE